MCVSTHLDNWRNWYCCVACIRVKVSHYKIQTVCLTHRCIITTIVKIFPISAKILNSVMMHANVTRCPFVNLIKSDSQYQ